VPTVKNGITGQNVKTTNKQFALFEKEAQRWIDFFGLKDVEVFFQHDEGLENSRASFQHQPVDRMAILYLSPDWDDMTPTDDLVRKTAFHEVCELLLSPLALVAESRYNVNPTDVEDAIHSVIRRLENSVFR
jgi:hypothetical protein